MLSIAEQWQDYKLLDAGGGEKLERWGDFTLRRPDAQVVWPRLADNALWETADAVYCRNQSGGGLWQYRRKLPERWLISYNRLSFMIEPTGFKHTGLFPEQAVNWDWMAEKIEAGRGQPRILNLFAYTGGASLACAAAGAAEVCHVDAARRIVGWARENLQASGLTDRRVRFIVDDAVKFVKREHRRGRHYDAVIMDPPVYGRGPQGELWQIERSLSELIILCRGLLSERPLFFLVNCYTTGLSPLALKNLLRLTLGESHGGRIEEGELGLPIGAGPLILPCGIFARWEADS